MLEQLKVCLSLVEHSLLLQLRPNTRALSRSTRPTLLNPPPPSASHATNSSKHLTSAGFWPRFDFVIAVFFLTSFLLRFLGQVSVQQVEQLFEQVNLNHSETIAWVCSLVYLFSTLLFVNPIPTGRPGHIHSPWPQRERRCIPTQPSGISIFK